MVRYRSRWAIISPLGDDKGHHTLRSQGSAIWGAPCCYLHFFVVLPVITCDYGVVTGNGVCNDEA